MLTGFFTAFISMGLGNSGAGYFMFLLIGFAFFWLQGNSIKFLKSKSLFKQLCLSTAQVYSPFLLVYIYGIGMAVGSGGRDSEEGAIFMVILGGILYVLFWLPYFRKLHLRNRALPSS